MKNAGPDELQAVIASMQEQLIINSDSEDEDDEEAEECDKIDEVYDHGESKKIQINKKPITNFTLLQNPPSK